MIDLKAALERVRDEIVEAAGEDYCFECGYHSRQKLDAAFDAAVALLLPVVEAAKEMERFDVTDGCEHCSAIWTREYQSKPIAAALAKLRKELGE